LHCIFVSVHHLACLPAVGQGRTGFRLTLKQMQYFSK